MQMTHLFYLKPRADNMVNHLNGTNENKQCTRNNVKPRCCLGTYRGRKCTKYMYLFFNVRGWDGRGSTGHNLYYTRVTMMKIMHLSNIIHLSTFRANGWFVNCSWKTQEIVIFLGFENRNRRLDRNGYSTCWLYRARNITASGWLKVVVGDGSYVRKNTF
jgi:hypothetical protein